MKQFEIMFSDLNEEAKERFLDFACCENEAELNSELAPLAIIDLEEENVSKDV